MVLAAMTLATSTPERGGASSDQFRGFDRAPAWSGCGWGSPNCKPGPRIASRLKNGGANAGGATNPDASSQSAPATFAVAACRGGPMLLQDAKGRLCRWIGWGWCAGWLGMSRADMGGGERPGVGVRSVEMPAVVSSEQRFVGARREFWMACRKTDQGVMVAKVRGGIESYNRRLLAGRDGVRPVDRGSR